MKRALLIVGSLILIFVAYRVLGVYEFRTGECKALKPRRFALTYPKHLTVMTFNIEGHASFLKSEHIAEIAKTIRKYNPDIVGINEAHRHTWQARFGDHAEELRRLTGMNVVFGRSYIFMNGEFGNAVLTRGTIVRSEVHELPGTGEPRTLLETIIRVNGGVVEFYVTHTSAWASMNSETRGVQLQCVNAHVNTSAYPFILVGDLNAAPESPEIARFLHTNTLQFAGDPKTPTHKVMDERLDYILTDPGWQVRGSRVLDEGPSDHRPVLAELVHP
ncbi:MAG TPA: endonuclease/exonuclease/phosphatase family protein [Thermoanaerobaculia bacterium]|nr:endonuclease/exonuclease/phosphatase family protein [Thermoanaerobaculia bacterium]